MRIPQRILACTSFDDTPAVEHRHVSIGLSLKARLCGGASIEILTRTHQR